MNRIIILFLLIGIKCLSQDFQAGIIIGVNTSQVSGDNLAGFNKLGTRCGAFVNKKLNNFIGQIEFQYINKGSKALVNTETYGQGYKCFLNYFEIPISLKKQVHNTTLLDIGCSVGYLLNWREEFNGYPDMGADINKLDYSVHIGIDYKLTKKIYLNTRLSNSIMPIRKHASEQTYRWNRGQYNTSLSFILHYYIGNIKN